MLMVNFLILTEKSQILQKPGGKIIKFPDWSQNPMTFCQFVMFLDFSMTIFIFRISRFSSLGTLWEP